MAVDVDPTPAAETVDQVRDAGGEAIFVHADVSKAADCAAHGGVAERAFGRLDVLFNNAGIMHAEDDDAVTTDEDVWDLTMASTSRASSSAASTASRRCGAPAAARSINTASFVALHGRGHAADRLHREQGRRAGDDARAGGRSTRARTSASTRSAPARCGPSC